MYIKTLVLALLLFSINTAIGQQTYYFPERNAKWQERPPSTFNLNEKKLNEAVNFAKSNEYSGSRDLRIAILKGFEREPFHQILGPTKKRGGPGRHNLEKRLHCSKMGGY